MRNTKAVIQKQDRKNRGSAMVTVIIVAAFITIIATTLLYVTAMNFQMKQVAYQNQTVFYDGETALEEVRGRITEDFTRACQTAYGQVMSQYVLKDEGNRAQLFRRMVYEALIASWNSDRGTDDWPIYIKEFVESKYQSGITIAYPDPLPYEGYSPIEYDEINGIILLKGIVLEYEKDGCFTRMTTDVYIHIPILDWSVQESKSSFEGTDAEENLKKLERQYIDASKCVVFTNWSKE